LNALRKTDALAPFTSARCRISVECKTTAFKERNKSLHTEDPLDFSFDPSEFTPDASPEPIHPY
jgi:hypothetical protein